MTLQPPDVVGPGEACAILKVSRVTFSRHKVRPEFPPATRLEVGDVYERRAIVAYAKQRDTGKPYLTALELYRMTDPAESAHARLLLVATGLSSERSISHTTVRRYLQQLGEIAR